MWNLLRRLPLKRAKRWLFIKMAVIVFIFSLIEDEKPICEELRDHSLIKKICFSLSLSEVLLTAVVCYLWMTFKQWAFPSALSLCRWVLVLWSSSTCSRSSFAFKSRSECLSMSFKCIYVCWSWFAFTRLSLVVSNFTSVHFTRKWIPILIFNRKIFLLRHTNRYFYTRAVA